MGYTHYWQSSAHGLPPAAVTMLGGILAEAYAAQVIQREHDDPRPPVVTEDEVRFNGVGQDGHETFCFNVHDTYRTDRGTPFAFCKTNRKPYDTVVMQVLIVLKYFLRDDLQVTSDGGFDAEWHAVREEMHQRYGIVTFVAEELRV